MCPRHTPAGAADSITAETSPSLSPAHTEDEQFQGSRVEYVSLEPRTHRMRAKVRGGLRTSQEPCGLQSKPQALNLLSTGIHKRQTQLRSIDNALEVKGVLRHDSALSTSHDRRDERTQ